MKSKEVEVEVNGKPTKVLIRNLLAGERNSCLRKAMKMNPMSTPPTSEIDLPTFNEMRLSMAIVDPRDLMVEQRDARDVNKVIESGRLGSEKGVRLLDAEVFDKLIAAIDEIDSVNPTESKSLETA